MTLKSRLLTIQKQAQKSSIYSAGLYGTEAVNTYDPEQYFKYQNKIKVDGTITGKFVVQYMTAIIDALILSELSDLERDDYEDTILTTLLLLMLKNGLPRKKTIDNTLYNYNYHGITYPIYRNLLLAEPFLTNNYESRVFIENNARSNAQNETKFQHKHLENVKTYITELPATTQIDGKKYTKIIQQHPNMNRTNVLNQSLKHGSLKGGVRKPQLNIPTVVDNTIKHIKNQANYHVKRYANRLSNMLGFKTPYTTKTWIWSGKVKTRHRMMSGATVPFDEPFLVTNERTGESCELRFPRDYANDLTGANTVNCGCSVSYDRNKNSKKNIMR